jgi:hypothetical protein
LSGRLVMAVDLQGTSGEKEQEEGGGEGLHRSMVTAH